MKLADYFYKCFVCYDPKILESKVHKDNVLKVIDVYTYRKHPYKIDIRASPIATYYYLRYSRI